MIPVLKEGVDYDICGPELYRDEYIRIVAYGGIPLYTAIGYTDDSIGYSADFDVICGPGKGLKTYDRIHEETIAPTFNALPEWQRALYAKGYGQANELTELNAERVLKGELGTLESINWETTSLLPSPQREQERFKRVKSRVRDVRFRADPTYGKRIYLRAPSTWPYNEHNGKLALKPTLKGATLREYHGGESYEGLFKNAEGGFATLGVVIAVDPAHTYVFNSNARISLVPKELLYGAKMTLSDYLAVARAQGITFYGPQMEAYASPADGFLPSDYFQHCIEFDVRVHINTATLLDREKKVLEIIPMKQMLISDKWRTFFKELDTQADSIVRTTRDLYKWFEDNIYMIVEGQRILKSGVVPYKTHFDKNTPAEIIPQKVIKAMVSQLQQLAIQLDPLVELIKQKVYPYIYKIYQIPLSSSVEEFDKWIKSAYKPNMEYKDLVYLVSQGLVEIIRNDYFNILDFAGNPSNLELMKKLKLTKIGRDIAKFTTKKSNIWEFLESLPPPESFYRPPAAVNFITQNIYYNSSKRSKTNRPTINNNRQTIKKHKSNARAALLPAYAGSAVLNRNTRKNNNKPPMSAPALILARAGSARLNRNTRKNNSKSAAPTPAHAGAGAAAEEHITEEQRVLILADIQKLTTEIDTLKLKRPTRATEASIKEKQGIINILKEQIGIK
jgi:hypothetical protein